MDYRFFIVDVFTDRAFGGNQLAVFPVAEGLAPGTMQAVAREFNFAETTFVEPATAPHCLARVRIFTPTAELPFAGHPTIGTAAVLAALGRLPVRQAALLEEGIGAIEVTAQGARSPIAARFSFRPRLEQPPGAPPPEALGRVLSLPPDAVRESCFAGVGLPFCLVRLAEREQVDQVLLDRAAWTAVFDGAWSRNLFLYAGDTSTGGRVYARMFAPGLGIEEDPATGSAAATLGAVLAHRHPAATGSLAWQVEQGVRMGRPSRIEVIADKGPEGTTVSVGGHSVLMGEGEMRL